MGSVRGMSESSRNGETAMGGGVKDGYGGDSSDMSGIESGESGRRTVSPARAVRHESNDCISRKPRGSGRKKEGERRAGESKMTPGPNGNGMYPPSTEPDAELPENGDCGTEPPNHCIVSAKMSVVGGPDASTLAPIGKCRDMSAPVTLCE